MTAKQCKKCGKDITSKESFKRMYHPKCAIENKKKLDRIGSHNKRLKEKRKKELDRTLVIMNEAFADEKSKLDNSKTLLIDDLKNPDKIKIGLHPNRSLAFMQDDNSFGLNEVDVSKIRKIIREEVKMEIKRKFEAMEKKQQTATN